MKKLLLITLIIITYTQAKFVDLGKEGATYDISEPNFMTELEDGVMELQKTLTRDKITKKIKKEIMKQSVGHSELPQCSANHNNVEPNYFILKTDIYNPEGRLYKQKGDSLIVENKVGFDICFIDATNKKEALKQIKYYDEVVKTLSGPNAECTYMVKDRTVLELDKEFYPRMFYPTGAGYEEVFNVSCYPTLIHLQDDKRYRFEVHMGYFKHNREVK